MPCCGLPGEDKRDSERPLMVGFLVSESPRLSPPLPTPLSAQLPHAEWGGLALHWTDRSKAEQILSSR